MTDLSASTVSEGSATPIRLAPHHPAHGQFASDGQVSDHGLLVPALPVLEQKDNLHWTSVRGAQPDSMWAAVRREAQTVAKADYAMARLVSTAVLDQDRLEDAVAARIAQRLATPEIEVDVICDAFRHALGNQPSIGSAMRADLAAVCERDPACDRHLEPLLYFKGYHALQTHRLAHWLVGCDRRDFALWLQSRSSEVFQTDINPAARIGKGIFVDHATGLVIGSTAVVDDDVSILHEVTLGGTGKESGDRHPKIKRGVLIGAGAKILGNITVGACAKVAAGSVVLHSVPAHATVAGVPARVVGSVGRAAPAHTMDQMLAEEPSTNRKRPFRLPWRPTGWRT